MGPVRPRVNLGRDRPSRPPTSTFNPRPDPCSLDGVREEQRVGTGRHQAGVWVLVASGAYALLWAWAGIEGWSLPLDSFWIGILWAVILFAGAWLLYGDQHL